jgi:hypothetical protein
MLETILALIFYAAAFFALAALAFGPFLLGMTDKRKSRERPE